MVELVVGGRRVNVEYVKEEDLAEIPTRVKNKIIREGFKVIEDSGKQLTIEVGNRVFALVKLGDKNNRYMLVESDGFKQVGQLKRLIGYLRGVQARAKQ